MLRCEGNALGPAGAGALTPALAASASLRELFLARCSLGPEGLAALAASLPTRLALLDASDNAAGVAGAAALAAALAGGAAPGLCSLLLCNNGMSDAGVVELARALEGRLESSSNSEEASGSSSAGRSAGFFLDLGGNSLGEVALAALSRCRLAALRLHGCSLGAAGALAVARLSGGGGEAEEGSGGSEMGGSSSAGGFAALEELDLSACGVPTEGLLGLLRALRGSCGACPRLRLLVLAANDGLEEEDVRAEVALLQEARPGLTLVRAWRAFGRAGRPLSC